MSSSLPGNCAIVGIGQTEFSKESGRSELQLACEAVSAALDDAGLAPSDVDGMVTFTMDSSDEIDIARNVGIGDLNFFMGGVWSTYISATTGSMTDSTTFTFCVGG